MNCPDCGEELKGRLRHFTCESCEKKWEAAYTCNVCGAIPELIASCGAASFFCNSCNSLRGTDNLNVELSPGV